MAVKRVEAVTIDGEVFLRAADVVAALRLRADEIDHQRQIDSGRGHPESILAYCAMSEELRQQSDWLDLAAIEYMTNRPDEE